MTCPAPQQASQWWAAKGRWWASPQPLTSVFRGPRSPSRLYPAAAYDGVGPGPWARSRKAPRIDATVSSFTRVTAAAYIYRWAQAGVVGSSALVEELGAGPTAPPKAKCRPARILTPISQPHQKPQNRERHNCTHGLRQPAASLICFLRAAPQRCCWTLLSPPPCFPSSAGEVRAPLPCFGLDSIVVASSSTTVPF